MSKTTGKGDRLLVDAGNTSVTLAVARGARLVRVGRLPTTRCTAAAFRRAVAAVLRGARADCAVLCSVVPAVNAVCRRGLRDATGASPLEVSCRVALGVRLRYPRPSTLGADRLANAAGAAARGGCPVVVADIGTAVTVDAVDAAGCFIGGLIAPGPRLMSDALAARTALLPAIDPFGVCGAMGRSTVTAMRLGVRLASRGFLREAVEHCRALPGMDRARVVVTGGYAGRVLRGTRLPYACDPSLTLYGLLRIGQLNEG